MRRPYKVTVEYEIIVVADGHDDAKHEAHSVKIPDDAYVFPSTVDWPEDLPQGVSADDAPANEPESKLKTYFDALEAADKEKP